jgi:hypothetical protein
MKNTQYLAQVFANRTSSRLLQLVNDRDNPKHEKLIKQYIVECGIFTFYNMLHAWKLGMGQDKSRKTNETDFSEWWQNSFPMPALPTFWNLYLEQNSNLTDVEKGLSPFLNLNKKNKKIKEIQSTLRKLFPDEIEICDEEIRNLETHAKEKIQIRKNAKKLGLNLE